MALLYSLGVSLALVAVISAAASPGKGAKKGISSLFKKKTNPYTVRRAFIDPVYKKQVNSSIASASAGERAALTELLTTPTAVWLSTKADVQRNRKSRIAKALKQASRWKNPPMVTLIVYNLPNRDCAAESSAGEFCCSPNKNGTCNFLDGSTMCEDGLRRYQNEYIKPLLKFVREYRKIVPMSFVVEPDSLPNLVTNLENPKCGNKATNSSYMNGIKFAVNSLSEACPHCPLYLDAAHGGWLGWEDSSVGFVKLLKKLRIVRKLRGFAINVSNYQEMGVICPEVGFCLDGANPDHECCKIDSCGLLEKFNPGHTILNYAMSLKSYVESAIDGYEPKFIVDTSRNGAGDAREDCSVWCNVRSAALGEPFTTETANKTVFDAYLYIKPPGESDGCTEILPEGGKCPRFDSVCASDDSVGSKRGEPRAPEAGDWFDYMIKGIATN
ncbi:exoglucanase 3 1,4-beta-cellobiohydrolase3 family GH6, Exoglucanase 3 (Pyrenophora tritici-repentis (strain Pt-1C-BFP)), Predicted CDS Pa_4_2420 (Podospora anserina) [Chondrus crispus]|uniref:Exoglucanase 3 1,4-beta-cellobiohydrolase3 family GH6, Exoglucanase 3 (Pyrenophora tritici-repentis (Strain Pt-1C-BFP)), Predicted CDS Pa_4_2420 (Podospora anserina) n=1 Tax=Chondrus crispus TaxID=2769 RepID=R7Q6G5_CHOCR|nr:exoglucanase 3 1,4-beta-cellobiohydrolase3 family GH6, Exoglucanase 3 (Pyrenophora tritici-repentis (strain Pt-1C-BFP)), Predicted CDS Pa_4_2420 (Podospora anserina) [Chondrus crispus]CDF34132.1 exoglucanase 3 1,4-beta-cellobiohydrolase3 family GH6, Exoglucanase 3 (Pyrenophora tritici-repentis (strain Pt-1C-BFP)), Predicted CDS Pa_4_2420 (Podospora anserina) [Chondrus crispus]|eukprot:XP_005713951.1 exoglucanase 3 1,4-beta-cellobiohydrolase3 family GH6, Exoglucanase 3 (Pyrenophora tritici-repentis (strain Pt-1C-BFP)), Predicted CDS Pa_4_2420 (Podospora anserina) [Chondrus crispus]